MDAQTVAIVGSILGVLLAINAFFVKSLVDSINKLNLKMTTVTIQHDHTVVNVKDLKDRADKQDYEIMKLREKMNSFDGATKQLLSYIESQE
jgi:hypothetical protein